MAMRSIMRRSGVLEWVLQRFSAVILALYTVGILTILVSHPQMDYATWKGIFDSLIMRISSLIALAAFCTHAWIGMWTITTDYMTPIQFGKLATPVRFIGQVVILILMFSYLVWGIYILWSI